VVGFHIQQEKKLGGKYCEHVTFSALKRSQFQRHIPKNTHGKRKTRNVMLMGYPMHAQRYVYGTGEFFQFRLSAELEIVEMLSEAGFRVLYKAHPETVQFTSKIMGPRVDEFITKPFETELHRADCLVFTYPLTTTFGAALATDIPIVMLDMEKRNWIADAYKKLKLRCAMVPASLDTDGRNKFSRHGLIEAIKAAPSLIDHSQLKESILGSAPQRVKHPIPVNE
jgi:hypothetical protein